MPGARSRIALDDRADELGAAHEVAAVAAGAVVGREELVSEVAVAGLDVDEVEPRLLGQHGPLDELFHEFVELVVGGGARVAGPDPSARIGW